MRGHRQDSISLLSLAITLTFTLLIFPPLATSDCFKPNGEQGGSQYKQCPYNSTSDADADASMCCASNRDLPFASHSPNGTETADECLENGLCINIRGFQHPNGSWDNATTYWRSMCNLLSWDGCLNVCKKSAVWYSAW